MSEQPGNLERNENFIKTPESDIDYTEDSEYRRYERQCTVCDKKFTRSIPKRWFTENGRLNHEELKRVGIDHESAMNIVEGDVCNSCDKKKDKRKVAA